MKKRWMIAGILAAMMLLFSGCMINPAMLTEKQEESESSEEILFEENESSEEEDAEQLGGFYDSVEEYLQSDIMQQMLETLKSSMQDVDIEVTANGNTLQYVYTYETEMDKDVIGPILDKQMEAQASTFKGIAQQVKSVVNVDEVLVEVIFLNPDQTVLSKTTFSSEDN